jgi:hypothetical protein
VLGLAASACGGTGSNADRFAGKPANTLSVFNDAGPFSHDPGSLLTYSCSEDQSSSGITTYSIEDWESGAGGGWYTNNDRCEGCQAATNTINGSIDAGALADAGSLLKGITARDQCEADCLAAQVPSYFAKPVPAEKIPDVVPAVRGRCGSQYAFHVISGPFTKWGGQLGINFGPPKCATLDCPSDSMAVPGAPYDGIAFWARIAPGSGQVMRVQVGESHTDIKYPEPGDAGPPCQSFTFVGAQNLGLGCDTFGTFIELNSNWQFITLPFEQMRQEGWGKRAPFFDIQHISNLTLFYAQGIWDIWIDDISFYRRGPQ